MFLNAILFTIGVLSAVVLGYWTQDRDIPVELGNIRASTAYVSPGGTLRIHIEANRNRNCRVHLEHTIFDGLNGRHTLPDDDFIIDPGPLGKDVYEIVLTVPRTAAEGSARYRSNRAYYCNPLQRILGWPIVSPPFESTVNDVPFQIIGPAIPTPVQLRPEYNPQDGSGNNHTTEPPQDRN